LAGIAADAGSVWRVGGAPVAIVRLVHPTLYRGIAITRIGFRESVSFANLARHNQFLLFLLPSGIHRRGQAERADEPQADQEDCDSSHDSTAALIT
jgi:hypothetical protein